MVYVEIIFFCFIFLILEKKLKTKIISYREKLKHKGLLRVFFTTVSIMFIPTIGLIVEEISNIYIALIFVILPLGFAVDIFLISDKSANTCIKKGTNINIKKHKINVILLISATFLFILACLLVYLKLHIIYACVLATSSVILDAINIIKFYKIKNGE